MSTKTRRIWLHKLGSAFIGGGAGAVTAGFAAAFLDPAKFNLSGGLVNTLKLMAVCFAINGVLTALAYLKQSPLPPIDDDDLDYSPPPAGPATKVGLIIFFAGLVSLTGCSTPGTGPSSTSQDRTARIAAVAEIAAYAGTTTWLSSHPQDRTYFLAAQSALSQLSGSSNATPADLHNALNGLPIKELQGEQGALIVGSALVLYDSFLREHVNLDNERIRPIAEALQRGLTRALGPPPQ